MRWTSKWKLKHKFDFQLPFQTSFSSLRSSQKQKLHFGAKISTFPKIYQICSGAFWWSKNIPWGPGGASGPLRTIQDGLWAFWDKLKKHVWNVILPHFCSQISERNGFDLQWRETLLILCSRLVKIHSNTSFDKKNERFWKLISLKLQKLENANFTLFLSHPFGENYSNSSFD